MLSTFSTPVLVRDLWQFKAVVFLYWCLICAVLLAVLMFELSSNFLHFVKIKQISKFRHIMFYYLSATYMFINQSPNTVICLGLPRSICMDMDKCQLAGQNLGRVFNFRYGRLCTTCTSHITTKVPNVKWKIWPKQLLGSLPLAFALPGMGF